MNLELTARRPTDYHRADGIRTPDLLPAHYTIGLVSTNFGAQSLFFAHPCLDNTLAKILRN
jgi:hypothetical protein